MDASFSLPKQEQIPPSNLFQILSRSFAIYARQFIAFFFLSALAIIPIAMFSQLFLTRFGVQLINQLSALGINQSLLNGFSRNDPQSLQALSDRLNTILANNPQALNQIANTLLAFVVVLSALTLIGGLVRGVLIDSTLTYLAAERGLGRIAPIEQGFGQASNRWLALTLSWITYFAILILVMVILIAFLVLASTVKGLALCIGVLFIALIIIVPMLLIYVSLTLNQFLTPVVTLEAVGPFAAIGRAWRLGKAHFWMLVMFQIAIGLIGGLVGLGIAALTANLTSMPTVTLLTAIGTSLTAPLGIIGATLLYIDARVRYDGLNDDLAYLGRLDARLNELPVRRAEGSLLGGSDVLNMIILVVLFVALSILLGVFGRSLGLIPNTPTTSATSLLIIKQSIGL